MAAGREWSMPLTSDELRQVAARTLAHYDHNARAFWEGTRDHDVSENISALLRYIQSEPPLELLDFGCGPGRDLRTFTSLGHHAIGLEGSAHLAKLAREHSGCEVIEQNFLELNLHACRFDGVFANAALFHVPSQALDSVLQELHRTLRPNGVLFSSNPRGDGSEGWTGDRYGVFHDWNSWSRYMSAAGFVELTHFYRPSGLPREQQPWLASVWRKPDR
jgi:SAM-dependent methyltransferase